MKRKLTYILALLPLILAACTSADTPDPQAPDGQQPDVWLSISLSASNTTGGERTSRAGDSRATDPLDNHTLGMYERRIKSLMLYLTNDAGEVQTVGVADIAVNSYLNCANEPQPVYVKLSNLYKLSDTKTSYRLYGLANMSYDVYEMLHNAALHHESIDNIIINSDSGINGGNGWMNLYGFPLITDEDDYLTFTYDPNESYPKEAPYELNENVLVLNKLVARIDYCKSSDEDKFVIYDSADEGAELNSTKNNLYVTPYMMAPFNEPKMTYLKYRDSSGKPVSPSPFSSVSQLKLDSKNCPENIFTNFYHYAYLDKYMQVDAFYSMEWAPDSPADDMSNTVGFTITCKLTCDETHPLYKYLNGEITVGGQHPDLYYYDDGHFQTTPIPVSEFETAPTSNPNWHKISWHYNSYVVTYAAPIKHVTKEGDGNEDGAHEFIGVKRNYVYQVKINKVKSLPRPVGSDTKDIDLSISLPAGWTYHRTLIDK